MKKIMIIATFLLSGFINEINAQNRPYHMRKKNLYGNVSEAQEYMGNSFAKRKHNLSGKTHHHVEVETNRRTYTMWRNRLSGNVGNIERATRPKSRFHKRSR